MRLLVLALALGLLAQTQDPDRDPDGHWKSEHQIPAGHACQLTRVYEENAQRARAAGKQPSAMMHPCDCSYSCQVDANGNVMEQGGEKSTQCKSFCSKDGRRCACHVAQPCDQPAGSARFDMNHHMIAMGLHR